MLEALELGVEALAWLVLPFGPARWNWALPQSRKTREAKRKLDSLMALMIAERRGRTDGGGPEDFLTRLVRLADAEGSITSDEQVRATFKMWFGADQLHALFTWTLWLLGQQPGRRGTLARRARRGARRPRGDRGRHPEAALHDQGACKESMRVYPPVWGFFRQMTEDFRLGDEVIPRGDLMGMSPWATHRDPRYWPDPLRFDPERWAEGAPRPPELSYFPFSSGPYECHGRGLAMKEAALILATLGQRWAYRPAGPEPKPTATWATEPKGGVRMKPVPRP